MLKTFITPLAAAAVMAGALTGLSAYADGVAFMVVDGNAAVAPIGNTRIVAQATAPAPVSDLRFDCTVTGTPVEFPNDIKIWSAEAVAAGTRVAWSVPGSSFDGLLELPALAANQHAFLPGVLPAGLPAGSPCDATLR